VFSITIYLHTIYQIQTPEGTISKLVLSVDQNPKIQDIVNQLKIPFHSDSTLLVVNGKIVDISYLMQNGDEVHIIPAISGGGC
jgi:molybdopterin converting factor small subunit